MGCAHIRPFQLTETVLEQLIGAGEVGTKPSEGRGAVLAGERLLPGGVKQLAVYADQQRGCDARVALVDAKLGLDPLRENPREVRHHLELLGLERRRFFDDPSEGRKARATEART